MATRACSQPAPGEPARRSRATRWPGRRKRPGFLMSRRGRSPGWSHTYRLAAGGGPGSAKRSGPWPLRTRATVLMLRPTRWSVCRQAGRCRRDATILARRPGLAWRRRRRGLDGRSASPGRPCARWRASHLQAVRAPAPEACAASSARRPSSRIRRARVSRPRGAGGHACACSSRATPAANARNHQLRASGSDEQPTERSHLARLPWSASTPIASKPAYRRSDRFGKRCALTTDWVACVAPPPTSAKWRPHRRQPWRIAAARTLVPFSAAT